MNKVFYPDEVVRTAPTTIILDSADATVSNFVFTWPIHKPIMLKTDCILHLQKIAVSYSAATNTDNEVVEISCLNLNHYSSYDSRTRSTTNNLYFLQQEMLVGGADILDRVYYNTASVPELSGLLLPKGTLIDRLVIRYGERDTASVSINKLVLKLQLIDAGY